MAKIDSGLVRVIFGLKLKQTRVEQSLTLTELSKLTGISKSYLTEIEQGKKFPKPEKIIELAKVLNVSYDYLVSLELNKQLAPISDFVQSGFYKSIPLDFIGINESELITILASAPARFSAFIDSLIQLASYYDIKLEDFYFSVLRSYQEMHDNFFEQLEHEANQIRDKYKIDNTKSSIDQDLKWILEKKYQYSIKEGHPLMEQFTELRYLVIPSKDGRVSNLFLNKNLNTTQRAFTFAREIGFKALNITTRPYVSSWIEAGSFEEIFNNFRAFYFGSALLLKDRFYISGLTYFLNQKKFKENELISVIQRSNVTPEVFMLRMTSLVPRYLRYNDFIFFRYNKYADQNKMHLTKELYGTGLSTRLKRSVKAKSVLRYAAWENLRVFDHNGFKWSIQKLNLENSDEQFLIIGITQDMKPSPNLSCYIGVAFHVNKKLKEKVLFLNDRDIDERTVPLQWVKETNQFIKDGLEHAKKWTSEKRKEELKAEIANILG